MPDTFLTGRSRQAAGAPRGDLALDTQEAFPLKNSRGVDNGMAMKVTRLIVQGLLSALFLYSGIMHFVNPAPFVEIVPDYLPEHLLLVWISGYFEFLGAIALWIPKLRMQAGWGLILLLIAVFPANVHMAVNGITFGGKVPQWLLWARLPFQAVLILATWWVSKK